jgi:Mrp family chromosome partitioning ATPase
LDSAADTPDVNENPDVRAYLRPLRDRAWLIALVVVVATATTYAYYSTRTKEYVATTSLLAQRSPLERALIADPGTDIDANDVAVLIESEQVQDAVARKLGVVSGSVQAEAVPSQSGAAPNVVKLTATASSGAGAARLANTYAATFASLTASQARQAVTDAKARAESELRQLRQTNDDPDRQRDLTAEIERLSLAEQLPAVSSQPIDRAVAPSAPTGASAARSALFAFVLSLGLSAVAVYVFALFDRRVRTPDEVGRLYDLPVLGRIPRDPNRSSHDGRLTLEPAMREALRTVRVNLQLRAGARRLRTIVVTSAVRDEGRSTVVRNLALEYLAAGQRAAVIDADATDSRLAELFLVGPEPGLTDVLVGERALEEALQPVGAEVAATGREGGNGRPAQPPGSIAVLSGGSQSQGVNAGLSAEALKPVLEELAAGYDVVLIDAPPLLPLSDSVQLLSAVDGVLLVARPRHLTREKAVEARGLLDQLKDANVIGVAVNDVQRGSLFSGIVHRA